MSGCGNCCGSCGHCGQLILSPGELSLLQALKKIPFLPMARAEKGSSPIYLEETAYSTEEYGNFLLCLEKKGLITIDDSLPLKNCNLDAYRAYPIIGSFALTQKGQAVVERIELQGIETES